MIKELKEIVESKRNLFRNHQDEMVASYKRELETTEGYNGRQLLELIQNCDDEGAGKIQISIDEDEQVLSVANTGKAFSLKGYRSIVTSNLSPKSDKKKFIGNKGLGFRSIVYWADEIQIQSNNILLIFSHNTCKKQYEQLFSVHRRMEIEQEYDLRKGTIPVSMLALPDIQVLESSSEFSTIIKIKYKEEFLSDIHNQVEELRPEILLFLHNIEQIDFEGFENRESLNCEKKSLASNKSFAPNESLQINDKHWYVFTKEGKVNDLPNDENLGYYQLKLAISRSMEKEYPYLFSYFPTKIRLNFPYIIHGTFDLDQTRNSLNDTERNRKVLEMLVSFIIETAKYYSDQKVDWRPIKLLNFDDNNKNDRLDELGFYELMDESILKEEVWPCVDGKYRAYDDIISIDDDFSNFILENDFSTDFPNVIIPKDKVAVDKYFTQPGISNIEEVIDNVSKKIDEVDVRADLIHLSNKNFPNNKFSFITNRNGEIVDKNDDVFTPSNKEIDIPSYCKIHFISNNLYNRLISKFNIGNATQKARKLQRILRSNCNIYSYEPRYLIQKIISQANEIISRSEDKHFRKQVVKEMSQSLFQMYLDMTDPAILKVENIPLLNIDGNIVYSKKLFLNDTFKLGKKAKAIFKNVRSADHILAYPKDYGLHNESFETLEEFFNWLGVNTFARIEVLKDKKKLQGDEYKYRNFICRKYDLKKKKFRSLSYTRIQELDNIISNLSIEELISWFCLDIDIQNQLHTDNINGKLTYLYYTAKHSYNLPSYLHYKLAQHGYNFEQHLVESKYNWANEIEVNFNHELFKELNIDSFEIEHILKLLGGKSNFTDLSLKRVVNIINSLPNNFPEGSHSQTTYKDAVKHYEKNEIKPTTQLKLFAKTNHGLEVLPQEKIYFSDRVHLPANQQDQFPTLNFPLRSGGQKAIEFFGINDLADVEVKVSEYESLETLNNVFNLYLSELKVYLFLYRLADIKTLEQKKREANYLRELNIQICSNIVFEIEGNKQGVQPYEYVSGKEQTYYIKCRQNDTLYDLRKNSKFSDSFSSILVDLFDVTKDKTEYRSLFRNGLEDAKHLTSQEFGTELIDESRISLGMGDNYSAFWSAVYKCFDKTFDGQDIEDDLELGTDIRTLNHDNLNSDNNIKILSSLFDELDVSVGAFNSQSFVKIDLTEYHFEKLKSKIFKLFKPFKVKSRERLIDSEIDERQKLLQIWFDFENCDTEIKNFANEKREDFTPDYQSFVNDYLSKFDLNIRNIEDYNYKDLYLDKIYETNLKEFDERERQQIIQDQELKSLLYYEDNLDYLYNILREKSQEDKKQSQADKSLNSDKEISDDKIKTIRGKKLSSGKSQKKSGRKKPYQPNNNDTENKNIGDRCEVWAKEELEKKFGIDFVDHVSKRDEGKHYDIRYSPDEGKSWKYVEVKNYAKSRFVLTQDEKKFGNKYSKNYEFHLVDLNNDIIYVAEDPYNTSDLHFEEKEYWVYYQLSDHKKA